LVSFANTNNGGSNNANERQIAEFMKKTR